jgi:hypothetical protein
MVFYQASKSIMNRIRKKPKPHKKVAFSAHHEGKKRHENERLQH